MAPIPASDTQEFEAPTKAIADALYSLVVESWTWLSLALAFVILRLWSRIVTVGVRHLWVDDYLMILVGVGGINL
jgi:hypothetical protein